MSQIAILEGYSMPRRRRRGRMGSFGRYRRKKRGGNGRALFGRAARRCAHAGHKPGTKSFGACMRAALKALKYQAENF